MIQTKVIGFCGGPGLGKSTLAAGVFHNLKKRGSTAELVLEVSKEWAWQGRPVGPYGQSILYGKQLERESRLYGKVEYIITDSPLVLCPIYQQHYYGHDTIKHSILKDLEIAKSNDIKHLNFLLDRTTIFQPEGRFEDEATSKKLDGDILDFLIRENIHYIIVDPSEPECVQSVVRHILKTYQEY